MGDYAPWTNYDSTTSEYTVDPPDPSLMSVGSYADYENTFVRIRDRRHALDQRRVNAVESAIKKQDDGSIHTYTPSSQYIESMPIANERFKCVNGRFAPPSGEAPIIWTLQRYNMLQDVPQHIAEAQNRADDRRRFLQSEPDLFSPIMFKR
jgi:hypothetical protein